MKYLSVIFLFLLLSCSSKTNNEKNKEVRRVINVDYGVMAFSDIQKENKIIIKKLEDCINSKEFIDYRKFWDKNDTLIFDYPYHDLYTTVNNNYPAYKPTVVGLQKIALDKYQIKIAVIGKPEGFFSLDYVYNVYAIKNDKGDFVFKNVISDNLSKWKKIQIDNITYYYSGERILNYENIDKQKKFETDLSIFLEQEKINYKYIICKNTNEIYSLLGYDYLDMMFYTKQIGGLAYSYQNIFFSGNDTEFYAHEVTHIYLNKKFPKIHSVIDEGFATYKGGSMGLNYEKHIELLQEYISTKEISIGEYLFDEDKRHTIIGSKSSIMYSAGAFLCHLAYSKYGKEGLFKLLNSGESDESLKYTIENLFQIHFKEFDDFFTNELEKNNYD